MKSRGQPGERSPSEWVAVGIAVAIAIVLSAAAAPAQTNPSSPTQASTGSLAKGKRNPVAGTGPAMLLPTRTDAELGTSRVALGPTLLLNYEKDAGSAGIVIENGWSLGGTGINALNEFAAQYFLTFNLPRGWFLYSNATITSDWRATAGDRWTVPVGGGPGGTFRIGKQSMSFLIQGIWNAVTPRGEVKWYVNPQLSLLFS